jgi:HSP20 family protein
MKGAETMLSALNARWGTLLSDPFEAVRREIESQFNGNGHARPTRNEFHRYGALSCWEDEGHYFLQMDVPGLKIEDLEVSLEKGQLTIRGERKGPEHGQKTWYDERAYGSFQRTVMLTEAVDAGSIDASLADGMLSITVAKRPEAKPQKITVKTQPQDQRRLSEN